MTAQVIILPVVRVERAEPPRMAALILDLENELYLKLERVSGARDCTPEEYVKTLVEYALSLASSEGD